MSRHQLFLIAVAALFAATALAQDDVRSSSSLYLPAYKKADVSIAFDTKGEGKRFQPTWGLDQAWISEQNLKKGINHMGKENVGIGRSAFRTTKALINDSALASDQITRLRQRANIFNQGIRNQVLDCEDELCSGDQLMIVKNNYYWLEEELRQATEKIDQPMSFLANGDRAIVRRVRRVHEQYGFHFAEVTMRFPDYDDYELTVMALLDTLTSEAPALTREQQETLYNKVMEDYADIPHKADRIKKVKTDRYYNAVQVKFAYAATCHKAQGGQWAHVYIDQGYMTDDMLNADYLHWLYTAFTRATEQLYLVNWPETQTDKV